MEARNSINAQIALIENQCENKNSSILIEETMNLLDGVGNFVSGDNYAPDRIYSRICGVKNIRLEKEGRIVVKVTSPEGKLLPSKICVRGNVYDILIVESERYTHEVQSFM